MSTISTPATIPIPTPPTVVPAPPVVAAPVTVAAVPERSPLQESLYEVVHGQRVEKSMSTLASLIAGTLYLHLGSYLLKHPYGRAWPETLFILDVEADLRRRPDVAFVSKERWPLDKPIPKEGDWHVVPDLAVEVVSPNDRFQDVIAKMEEYFSYQVKQVWLVLPVQKQVYVYDAPTRVRILAIGDELEASSVVPGFRIALADWLQQPE
jgi:Uma2 family endonuclease